jgi:hypothetical protein
MAISPVTDKHWYRRRSVDATDKPHEAVEYRLVLEDREGLLRTRKRTASGLRLEVRRHVVEVR